MKQKITITTILAVVALIFWTFYDLRLSTKRRFHTTQRLLESGASLEEIEKTIGGATQEYSAGDIPDYLKSMNGFEERKGTIVRVYNKEGLPYWWAHLQIEKKNSEIVWYAVGER